MIIRHTPLLVSLLSACIFGVSNVGAADFLSDQQDASSIKRYSEVLNVPLKKFSVIAENFKANHLILTSSDYSFDAIDFFAGGQNLLTHSPFPTGATPKTQGMVLASLGLMIMIVRRRSYR